MRLPALLSFLILAAAAVGCGGSDVAYEEVPGPPAQVTVPEDTSALAAEADDAEAAEADETPTPDASGGATAPSTTTPVPTATAAPPVTTPVPESGGAGAPSEDGSNNEFDAFCNENPGACD